MDEGGGGEEGGRGRREGERRQTVKQGGEV